VNDLELRPEVMAFAEEMERKLRKNDTKRTWTLCPADYLAQQLVREACELLASMKFDKKSMEKFFRQAIDSLDAHDYSSDPKPEAVDVSNFSMMIFDNFNHGRY
jgi:hypothetical protein